MAANFGSSVKRIKTISIEMGIFQKNSSIHPSHKSNEEILEELKVKPVDKYIQYKSNWVQHVRRVNNRMPKLMWKYRRKGRDGGTWKATGQGRIRAIKAQLMTNYILFRIKSFEVLVQFSPVFCYFLPLRFYSRTPSSFVLPLM
jgi:hypothetical protein